ncbi:hypothetical protein FQN57_002963 [Myotisia sp. PD_48]|nr:hypothetical protein FQN57_002963 [Myotisia sp. PD_48]
MSLWWFLKQYTRIRRLKPPQLGDHFYSSISIPAFAYILNMASKRKLSSTSATSTSQIQKHPRANLAYTQGPTTSGFVLPEFYPPEISNARCQAYTDGTLERPMETLERALIETTEQRNRIPPGKTIVFWFKSDLRLHDNRALQRAYQAAQAYNVPLVCLYILSPEDLTAHMWSPPRIDMALRTLNILKRDLDERDIPLYMTTQTSRSSVPHLIVDLCIRWEAKHLFANLEYEVDELRREAKLVRLCAENEIHFDLAHDTCVVPPGPLATQQGKQYSVYTPWYRSWLAYLKSNPENLQQDDAPGANHTSARHLFGDLFDCEVPAAPMNKRLSEEEKERFQALYPEGEHEALRRLQAFLQEKGKQYNNDRNNLSGETTSILSPYFASGALSARAAVCAARDANRGNLDGNNSGYTSWISEVAWRDFYKHVMNKCFKPEFTNMEWSYDMDQFDAWCQGRTGFPIVDAAMRQLKHSGWMHNRTRMVVASFLSKDLLIDWRLGERYFMEHLIDGDFASNHGGWGFGSSTGVDPQPYFRIFNPVRQSERFDPSGDYIRTWVPELRDIKDSRIHDPYNRGAENLVHGYPQPMVNHSESRKLALERYKAAALG